MNKKEAFVIANHVTEDVNETADTIEDIEAELTVDDFIKTIGEFGKAQKLITLIICLMIVPCGYQNVIIVFIGDEPPWSCISDNITASLCDQNGTFLETHSFYQKRCSMSRLSWTFTKPEIYSVVTQVSLLSYFTFTRDTLSRY